MIIINNKDRALDILEKINYLVSKYEKTKFIDKKEKIELLIKTSNKILLNYSELKFLRDSIGDLNLEISLLWIVEWPVILKNLDLLWIKYGFLEDRYKLFKFMKSMFSFLKKARKYIFIVASIMLLYCLAMVSLYFYKSGQEIYYIEKDFILSSSSIEWPKLNKLSLEIDHELVFLPNNIDFSWTSRSIWSVSFENKSGRSINLVEKTRLKNSNWLIFRIIEDINIPPSSISNGVKTPWIIKTTVIADIFDQSWSFIWQRWNIEKNTNLELVSKNNFNLNIKALDDFYWWKGNYVFYFKEKDEENVLNIFRGDIKNKAIAEASKKLMLDWAKKNKEFLLVKDSRTYSFQNYEVNLDKTLEKQIKLNWKINLDSYYIDITEVKNLMIWDTNYKKEEIKVKNIEILSQNPLKISLSLTIKESL